MSFADERDFAEERANLRLLHTGDGELDACPNGPDCLCQSPPAEPAKPATSDTPPPNNS